MSSVSTMSENVCRRLSTRRSQSAVKRRSQNMEMQTSSADNCKENMKPFISESDTEEDEVFFGNVNDRERSKMAKLRRKTQVFVSNFRDISSSESGTESFNESSSTHCSSWSHDSSVAMSSSTEPETLASSLTLNETEKSTLHPKQSHLQMLKSSSTDSPSVLAHRAAAKIQTWFRLSRQAQEHQGIMREVEELEQKTDDFILKIRQEKDRRQQCSGTSEQRQNNGGGGLDSVLRLPMVVVPSHKLQLVETSPQQNNMTALQQSPNPVQLSPATDVFNATNDSDSIRATPGGTSSSLVEFDESISESGSAQSELPQADSDSSCTATEQERCGTCTPDGCVLEEKESSLHSTPSCGQSDVARQVTSVPSAVTRHQGTYSKVASDVKADAGSVEDCVGSPSKLGNTLKQIATDTPFMQVGKPSANYQERTPLRQLQMSGTLSSFPKVAYEQIQSPTLFSSPRLFPVTVQAGQPQQSASSAVLFSPLKIAGRAAIESDHAPETWMSHKVTESGRSQRELGKENQTSPIGQPTALNAASMRHDLGHHARPPVSSSTTASSSIPIANLLKSPIVNVLRSGQKLAIITPNSALLPITSRSASKSHSGRRETEHQAMPIAEEARRQHYTATQEHGRSHQFFPSPVVNTINTPESQTPSAYEGQQGIMSSPFTGVRTSELARCKLELLEQKRAELARLRAEKAELKQTLKTEDEMCFTMKREVQAALRSNTSQSNIPAHLLSIGCQGVSSLTLTDQELDVVTRLHTIRNCHHDNLRGVAASPMVAVTPHKGSHHLQWHSDLVTEVHHLSSPCHPVRVARPILVNQDVCKARRVPSARTASPARRVPTRRHPCTPREKLAF